MRPSRVSNVYWLVLGAVVFFVIAFSSPECSQTTSDPAATATLGTTGSLTDCEQDCEKDFIKDLIKEQKRFRKALRACLGDDDDDDDDSTGDDDDDDDSSPSPSPSPAPGDDDDDGSTYNNASSGTDVGECIRRETELHNMIVDEINKDRDDCLEGCQHDQGGGTGGQ